ncbi:MAG: hypothetical protein HY738_19260, partial [Bacteroidia bacterium]|nr:hypothetical protein [Bacteroidia bacterium]
EARIREQHGRGKLTARERIDFLLDPGSFQETGQLNLELFQKIKILLFKRPFLMMFSLL